MKRLLWVGALLIAGCAAPGRTIPDTSAQASPAVRSPAAWGNLAHLDYLGEDVVVQGDTARFVHIYAEAPDWRFVGDEDEGIACVDDAARAAVLYLRRFEVTGDPAAREKAVRLLRFVRHLQAPSGLFYNFVWDRRLTPNTEHPNSRADGVSWWTARAVWALGEGTRVLGPSRPAEAAASLEAVRRVEPHLDRLLARYGETAVRPESGPAGRPQSAPFPLWLVAEIASDATSELLLGLVAVERTAPTPEGARRVRQFADGVAATRRGTLASFPYGGHAAWPGSWHGWGNSQSQALAESALAGVRPDASSAEAEAHSLYAHLLVEGWRHEMDFPSGATRTFEQIAYMVRPVAVALVRLHTLTGRESYAVMAGLAASWFTGDNAAGALMADSASGRGYDGIQSPTAVNPNAGAESTIEAQYALFEVEQVPAASRWLGARSTVPITAVVEGRPVRYRIWQAPDGARAVVVLDPAADTSAVFAAAAAEAWLARLAHSPSPDAPGRPGSVPPLFPAPLP